MNIISHRGAAGLAKENTKEAIIIGSNLGAKYVEFDVQKTADNKLIITHNLATPSGKKISRSIYSDIKKELPELITLQEALANCKPSPALIEIKSDSNTAESLFPFLLEYPNAAITSFHINQLISIKKRFPKTSCFLMQHKHPFGLISKALSCNAYGIGISKNWFWLLPLFVNKAHKNSLSLYIYTLNNLVIAKMINSLYPHILICTDNPKRLLK